MSDLKRGLAAFFGSLYDQRITDAKEKKEDEQWERRLRLSNQLGLEVKRDELKLSRKDGNTFKEGEDWVTEILDGGGNVVGKRPATPAERAAVEGTVSDATKKAADAKTSTVNSQFAEQDATLGISERQERIKSAQHTRSIQSASLGLDRARLALQDPDSSSSVESAANQVRTVLREAGNSTEDKVSADSLLAAFNVDLASASSPQEKKRVVADYLGVARNRLNKAQQAAAKELRGTATGANAWPLDPNNQAPPSR